MMSYRFICVLLTVACVLYAVTYVAATHHRGHQHDHSARMIRETVEETSEDDIIKPQAFVKVSEVDWRD